MIVHKYIYSLILITPIMVLSMEEKELTSLPSNNNTPISRVQSLRNIVCVTQDPLKLLDGYQKKQITPPDTLISFGIAKTLHSIENAKSANDIKKIIVDITNHHPMQKVIDDTPIEIYMNHYSKSDSALFRSRNHITQNYKFKPLADIIYLTIISNTLLYYNIDKDIFNILTPHLSQTFKEKLETVNNAASDKIREK